jgi:hypothetical protein
MMMARKSKRDMSQYQDLKKEKKACVWCSNKKINITHYVLM